MKESLTHIESDIIRFEGCQSEQGTRKKGGVPTDVAYLNGIASSNGSSSKIIYTKAFAIYSEYTVILKGVVFNNSTSRQTVWSLGIEGSGDSDIIGLGVQSGIGTDNHILFAHWTSSWQVCDSGVVPVDGEKYDIYAVNNGTNLIIYVYDSNGTLTKVTNGTGGALNASGYTERIFTRHDGANLNYHNGDIDNYTFSTKAFTDEEIQNDFENRTYKELSTGDEVLSIDPSRGFVADRWGNTLTPTDVIPIRNDNYYVMPFDGLTSKIVCGDIGEIKSLSFWIRLNSNTEKILEGQANNELVYSNAGTLTYPFENAYIDDEDTDSISANEWHCVTLNSSTVIDFSAFTIGLNNTTYGKFWLGVVKVRTGMVSLTEHVQFLTSTKHLIGL